MKLQLDEHFPSPIETVWRAITDRAILERWLMANDFEPRLGHAFTLRDPPDRDWRGWIACEVLELVPPCRMVWSWSDGMSGDARTRVVFELRPEGDGTHLTLRHEDVTEPSRHRALACGWTRRMALLLRVVGPHYARRVAFASSRERVFDAVASPVGSGAIGEFWLDLSPGSEPVAMRVGTAERPCSVQWSRTTHSDTLEGTGQPVLFQLVPRGASGCELAVYDLGSGDADYRDGARGAEWDAFFDRLVAHVDLGEQHPCGGHPASGGGGPSTCPISRGART